MDLSTLKTTKADDGAVLELVHPATEEVIPGMTITLLGRDSKRFKELELKQRQATLNRVFKGKKQVPEAADMDRQELEELVLMTVGWAGIELNGSELEFTSENVAMIYSEYPWILEQAKAFVRDRSNFLSS